MKKFLALFLAAMMLLSTAAMAAEPFEGYYTPPKINEGQYPIKDKDVKLTYWMTMNAGAANFIASHDENPSYQYIQEQTGVDIEFIHPAAGTEGESFKTLMMRDELPDMIQMTKESWYSGGLQALYDDGVIIDVIMNGTASFSCMADAEQALDETFFYPPIKHGYVSSICGKACDTACYIHLEEQGKLTKTFKRNFRIRPEWKLD